MPVDRKFITGRLPYILARYGIANTRVYRPTSRVQSDTTDAARGRCVQFLRKCKDRNSVYRYALSWMRREVCIFVERECECECEY